MDLHSLYNFSISETKNLPPTPGGLRPTADAPKTTTKTSTASTFITPQSLAAFPLASGVVAAFWKGAQFLGGWGKPTWVCFVVAMLVAAVNYAVSITDPKLQASAREKVIGGAFAVINGMYLFVTAMGINVAIK